MSCGSYARTERAASENLLSFHIRHCCGDGAVKAALDGEGLFGAAQDLLRSQTVDNVALKNIR